MAQTSNSLLSPTKSMVARVSLFDDVGWSNIGEFTDFCCPHGISISVDKISLFALSTTRSGNSEKKLNVE